MPFVPDKPTSSFVPDAPSVQAATPSFVPDVPAVSPVDPPSVPRQLPESEIRSISQKYGVDPTELRQLAPYYGVTAETEGLGGAIKEGAKYTAGYAGRSVGLGIPQFLYKKTQEPAMRKALDELNQIGQQQREGSLESASEFVVPTVGIPNALHRGGKLVQTATRAAEGLGLAGVVGAVSAPEGQELQSAKETMTSPVALGLVGAGAILPSILTKSSKPSVAEQQIIKESAIDLNKGVDEIAGRTGNSEGIIDDSLFGKRGPLSQLEVNTVLKEQLAPDTIEKLLHPSTTEGEALHRIVLSKHPEEVLSSGSERVASRQLAQDIIESRAKSFAEELTGTRPHSYEEAISNIDEVASRQGAEATRSKYNEWKKSQQAAQYITEIGARATDQPGFTGRAANFISDNQFVLRHLDDKYGTKLEPALSEASSSFNRSTYALDKFRRDQHEIFTGASKLGVDKDVVNSTKLYDALNSGNLESLSPAELKVAQGFRAYFDNIRDFANGASKSGDPNIKPLNIPYLKDYVPQQMKTIPETVGILEAKLERAKQVASQVLGREVQDIGQLRPQEFQQLLNNPNIRDLGDAVKLLDKREITDAIDLSTRLKELMHSRDGNIALESVARAALERKGGIPDFLLEKNLYKLADKYTANTMRHLYLREPLDKLRFQAKSLRKLGADTEAEYVENIVRDMLGVRRGTAAEAMLQGRVLAHRKVDSLIQKYGRDSVRGGALTVAKAIPDMLQALTKQIYPNVLGYFNMRAVLQNATQSITKLAPELGTKYGYSTVVRSAVYTTANFRRLIKKAEEMGTVPAEFSRKGERAIAEGIQRSALYNIPKSALDGMAKAGMYLYQKMEQINRALTLGTAEMMAHDLTSGSKLAQESLQKFPATVQQAVQMANGNKEEIARVLGHYLNDVTQYNYNRVSLSEFGRTMGPFFSTFSKWPTATAGDMIYTFRNKGVLKGLTRNAEKYIAPLLILEAAHHMMLGKEEELNDVQKKVVGSGGLPQSAPIGAVKAIATGEIFSPPAVDVIMQSLIMPSISGDTSKLSRGAASAAQNFIPGAGLARFLTDDLVTYATGNRPEGSDFVERTQEGTRTILRKAQK